MSEIRVTIDGREVTARARMTVLEAARSAGISIPSLCHHEKLEPYGGCRLCIVELVSKGSSKLVVSCVQPVEKDQVVRTRSEKVDRIRKTVLELLMAHAPDAPVLLKLAEEYGADRAPHRAGAGVLRPLQPVRPVLRRGQEAERHRFHRPGHPREISFIPEIAAALFLVGDPAGNTG